MCNCNTNCGCTTTTIPCECSVKLNSDCIDNVTEDLTCSNILKGQTLTEVLVLLDAYICDRFTSVEEFIKLINVGAGSQIYKGDTLLGKKQLRTLVDSGLINIVQATDTITISVDEVAMNTFIESNQKTYSASNIGTGAQVYKNTTIVGDNTQLNLRKIKSSNSSVSIVEGTDDIDVTVSASVIPDGSETKVTAGTNVSVTGAGTIASPYIVNSTDTNTIADGSETKINSGTNTTVTGVGTIVAPYVINSPFQNLQNTIDTGGHAEVDGGESWIDILSGEPHSRIFNIGLYSGSGYNNSTEFYIEPTSINLYNSGIVKEGGMNIDSGDFYLYSKNKTLNKYTTLRFIDPIANTTLNFPAKSTAGTYIIATLDDIPSLNLQKTITYPADFTGTNYTITNADNNYTIIVNNATTACTITVPSGLMSKIGVGFIQKGTADVTFVASGTTIQNPIGLKSKGQYYQTFIEQELATNVIYLLGNTRA